MNKKLIPPQLYHLIPFVERWGIVDNHEREEAIDNANAVELPELVNIVSSEDEKNLNEWLDNPKERRLCTAEYLKYNAFLMAYKYANDLLLSRKVPRLRRVLNKELIPTCLHHLIPLVDYWGIEDDGERGHLIYNSSTKQLSELIQSFSNEDANNLNEWLIDEVQIKMCTSEYIKYSAFFEAYEYAKSLLKSRIQNR
jgi:hypothetical protein